MGADPYVGRAAMVRGWGVGLHALCARHFTITPNAHLSFILACPHIRPNTLAPGDVHAAGRFTRAQNLDCNPHPNTLAALPSPLPGIFPAWQSGPYCCKEYSARDALWGLPRGCGGRAASLNPSVLPCGGVYCWPAPGVTKSRLHVSCIMYAPACENIWGSQGHAYMYHTWCKHLHLGGKEHVFAWGR